jgi:hypothetical protein
MSEMIMMGTNNSKGDRRTKSNIEQNVNDNDIVECPRILQATSR